MTHFFKIPNYLEPKESTFEEAKTFLYQKKIDEFLARLAYRNVDYTPLEKTLRHLTSLIHATTGEYEPPGVWNECGVLVIPRGSFATRTALKGHADLDVDIIFPDSYQLEIGNRKRTLRDILGTDETNENIVFERESLKEVLIQVCTNLLEGPIVGEHLDTSARNWLEVAKPKEQFTRSISLKTKTNAGAQDAPAAPNEPAPAPQGDLPIDLFIKVKTKVRGEEIIIGVDKDGPLGVRRYQTTAYIPREGKWLGDRILPPVERAALLALKWWKTDLKDGIINKYFDVDPNLLEPEWRLLPPFHYRRIEIKSHHLLAALNALHELDINDELYLPRNFSHPFSPLLIMETMWKILEYLNRAYHPSMTTYLLTEVDGEWEDYPFPRFSYQVMDTLYTQASADWDKFQYIVKSKVLSSFRDEIKLAMGIKPSPA